MASQVSLPNHSVTSMCVVDEENVYRISINGVKVMEKADEELGFFLRKKFSLFTQMNCFTLLAPLKVSRFGQCLSEAFCHASVVCVCVCVRAGRKTVVGAICRVQRSCNLRLIRPLRLQDARLHSQTNTCHVDFTDSLGCEQVISKLQNLVLMQLPVFKERLKYTTPTYMKTHKTIHHQ